MNALPPGDPVRSAYVVQAWRVRSRQAFWKAILTAVSWMSEASSFRDWAIFFGKSSGRSGAMSLPMVKRSGWDSRSFCHSGRRLPSPRWAVLWWKPLPGLSKEPTATGISDSDKPVPAHAVGHDRRRQAAGRLHPEENKKGSRLGCLGY